MYLCKDLLCIITSPQKIQGCQMLRLHEHLEVEEDSAENMINNSVQERKIAFRTP